MTCKRCDVLVAVGESYCQDCQQLHANKMKEFYKLPGSKKHKEMPTSRFRIFLYKLSMKEDKWFYRICAFCCCYG